MQYTLHLDNTVLTDLDRNLLDEKLDRLEKHLKPPYTTSVTFIHDAHHRKGEVMTCRINIRSGQQVFHTERVSTTIQDSLDEVIDSLKRALERHED